MKKTIGRRRTEVPARAQGKGQAGAEGRCRVRGDHGEPRPRYRGLQQRQQAPSREGDDEAEWDDVARAHLAGTFWATRTFQSP